MTDKIKISIIYCFLLSWMSLNGMYASPDSSVSQKEVVDRIVALVNEEVITLTDVRIVKAFNLFISDGRSNVDIDINYVLKKLIDQNLVIQLTRGGDSVQSGTVDDFLDQIIVEMGVEEFRNRLEQFGLARSDLGPYADKCIMYQSIIADRFKTSTSINLKEIEEYYEQTYLPVQDAAGLEAKPMLEILDEIEAVIQQEKSKMQVEEWLQNLRQKADIQVNL